MSSSSEGEHNLSNIDYLLVLSAAKIHQDNVASLLTAHSADVEEYKKLANEYLQLFHQNVEILKRVAEKKLFLGKCAGLMKKLAEKSLEVEKRVTSLLNQNALKDLRVCKASRAFNYSFIRNSTLQQINKNFELIKEEDAGKRFITQYGYVYKIKEKTGTIGKVLVNTKKRLKVLGKRSIVRTARNLTQTTVESF